MAAMSGHGSDAKYECEASCGFRGTFDAVHEHEKTCEVLKASTPGAISQPSSIEDIMALAQAQLDSPGSPTSPEAGAEEKTSGLGAAAEQAGATTKKKKGISFGGVPEPEPEPSSRPNRVMQGWLTKQGHIRRNWKSRFFVIWPAQKDGRLKLSLLYFKKIEGWEDLPPTGMVELDGATIIDHMDAPADQYGFCVVVARGKKYPLRATSSLERDMWLTKLKDAIKTSSVVPPPAYDEATKLSPADNPFGAGGAADGAVFGGSVADSTPMGEPATVGSNFPPPQVPPYTLSASKLWDPALPSASTAAPAANEPATEAGDGGGGGGGGGVVKKASFMNELKLFTKNPAKTRSASIIQPKEMTTSVGILDFDLLHEVGKGAFGKVFLVRKRDGEQAEQLFAMKVLDKANIKRKGQVAHTKSERDILHEIQHPFIVWLHYAFQTDRKLYMVTDYYPGGNLFSHLCRSKASGGFTEARTRFYAAELMCALDFLHQNNIVYRDLKLENILMDAEGHICLTDFGLSKDNVSDVKKDSMMTFCGTVEYMPPELVKGEAYSMAVDWWSFGVLVYEMLTTKTPFFSDQGRRVIFAGIVNSEPVFHNGFTPSAKTFIQGLLKKESTKRLGMGKKGVNEIKKHAWFAEIDWSKLLAKEVQPPWTPDVKGAMDFRYVPKRLIKNEARDSEQDEATVAQGVKEENKWDGFSHVPQAPGPLGDE